MVLVNWILLNKQMRLLLIDLSIRQLGILFITQRNIITEVVLSTGHPDLLCDSLILVIWVLKLKLFIDIFLADTLVIDIFWKTWIRCLNQLKLVIVLNRFLFPINDTDIESGRLLNYAFVLSSIRIIFFIFSRWSFLLLRRCTNRFLRWISLFIGFGRVIKPTLVIDSSIKS